MFTLGELSEVLLPYKTWEFQINLSVCQGSTACVGDGGIRISSQLLLC